MGKDTVYGLSFIAALIVTAIVAYHFLEGWDYVDSAYFAVSTITTVGYGDLVPKTEMGRIFTIFYMLAGVSTGFYLIISLGQSRERMFKERFEHMVDGIRSRNGTQKKREGRFVQEKFQ